MEKELTMNRVVADCGCFDTGSSLPNQLESKFRHLWGLVGNTPMLEIAYKYKDECRKIYVKCENYNLTGSIKDRMALYILQQAYRTDVRPLIAEARLRAGGALQPLQLFRDSQIRKQLIAERGLKTVATGL